MADQRTLLFHGQTRQSTAEWSETEALLTRANTKEDPNEASLLEPDPSYYTKKRGLITIIAAQLVQTYELVVARYFFLRYPTMTSFEFQLYHASFAIVFMVLLLNTQVWAIIKDPFQKGTKLLMLAKSLLQSVMVILGLQVARYFPLNYKVCAAGIAPFFALIFAALLLKELPTRVQLTLTVIMVSLNTTFIFSGHDPLEGAAERFPDLTEGKQRLAWAALVLVPVLMGLGQIIMRSLRRLEEMTVPLYVTTVQIAIVVTGILMQGSQFTFHGDFTAVEWVLLALHGVLSVIGTRLNFISVKCMAVPERQSLLFFSKIYVFLADTFLFHEVFCVVQYVCISLIVLFKVVQAGMIFCFKRPKDHSFEDDFRKEHSMS